VLRASPDIGVFPDVGVYPDVFPCPTQGRDGWTSTVKITLGGEGFTGAVCMQKKAAQQSAAKQAYERLAGTS